MQLPGPDDLARSAPARLHTPGAPRSARRPRLAGATGTLLSALGLLLASCSGGGGAARGNNDVQVMSFAPKGSIAKAEPITIRFDKPVVEEARVGKPADPDTVTVSPAFPWTGYWQDQRTLVIDPSAPLWPSTRYDVTLAGELGRRTADFKLSFVHRPLSIEGLWGDVPAALLPTDGPIRSRSTSRCGRRTWSRIASSPARRASRSRARPRHPFQHRRGRWRGTGPERSSGPGTDAAQPRAPSRPRERRSCCCSSRPAR